MCQKCMDFGGYLLYCCEKVMLLLVLVFDVFELFLKGMGEGCEILMMMVFVWILNILLKDKVFGKCVVLIVLDELCMFGMEGLFCQIGIWNQEGQKYVLEDFD